MLALVVLFCRLHWLEYLRPHSSSGNLRLGVGHSCLETRQKADTNLITDLYCFSLFLIAWLSARKVRSLRTFGFFVIITDSD